MRDMTDIDMLLTQHQSKNSAFIANVVDRAIELGVDLLVFYAFRYLTIHLNTSINDNIFDKFQDNLPSPLKLKFMDSFFAKVLFSP